jgi:putative membrane protein
MAADGMRSSAHPHEGGVQVRHVPLDRRGGAFRGRTAGALASILSAGLVAGCAGQQAALAPQSAQAAQIAQLWWGMLIAGSLILLAVMVLLAIALQRGRLHEPQPLTRRQSRNLVVFGGVVIPAVILIGFVIASALVSQAVSALPPADALRIWSLPRRRKPSSRLPGGGRTAVQPVRDRDRRRALGPLLHGRPLSMTRTCRTTPGSWWLVPAAMAATPAQAHAPPAQDLARDSVGWLPGPWELTVVALLAAAAWLYAAGMVALWRNSRLGGGIAPWRAGAYAAGWLALAVALVSPIDLLGGLLFSVHMVQHEVLMLVAAPLLVLGRPLAVYLWALPPRGRARVAAGVRASGLQAVWRALTAPLAAWGLAAGVLWVWHLPALFNATLRSDAIHAVQHICFLLSALVFWHVFLPHRTGATRGAAVLYIFTTAMHSSVLGALLTFAPSAWYAGYQSRALAFGLTPLEDQQLGGLLMWIPAGMAYLAAALGWMAELAYDRPPKSAAGELRDDPGAASRPAEELLPGNTARLDMPHARLGSDG